MRILLTNFDLSFRGGTQLYVRDLALSLQARGHEPNVYASRLGTVSDELQGAGIPVVENLDQIRDRPDIIHGNQHVETMTALLFFPHTPAVYFCHSAKHWMEAPPIFPRVMRYVAVDDTCYRRLVEEHNVNPAQARVILNFVDLNRFKPRGSLPDRPQRALVFSNNAHEKSHLQVIQKACERVAIELEVIGEAAGRVEPQPELRLGNYDLVFAKARAALEALAVGNAVILCDASGSGPLVTSRDVDGLRRLNFGIRALDGPLTVEAIEQQIARYDARDAETVSQKIRALAGLEAAVDEIAALYEEVLDEFKMLKTCADDEGRAAARYLSRLHSDFAFHSALTMRWRNRLLQVPYVGPRLISWRDKLRRRRESKSI